MSANTVETPSATKPAVDAVPATEQAICFTGPEVVAPDSMLPEDSNVPALTQTTAKNLKIESSSLPDDMTPTEELAYSVLSERAKAWLMIIASFAAVISPFATGMFYPAVNALAVDLDKSVSLINISISTYQILQGIAPSFTAGVAERYGRRPAYLLCLSVYFCANLGLALQNNYAALLVLRMLQSAGSSGTMALASGVIGDLGTRAERGKYIAYATIGSAIGPLFGPTIGGLLTTYLGWRSVFWFLVIFSAVMALIMIVCFRETSRAHVGDGSLSPPRYNMSVLQLIGVDKASEPHPATLAHRPRRLNPFSALAVMTDRASFIQCIYGGLLYAGFASVTAILTSQLEEKYHYSAVVIGLCYLPLGFGGILSRWTTSKFLDWNFARELRKQGIVAKAKGYQQEIENFNIEKARLAATIPMVAVACALVIAQGFLLEYRLLAPTLVVLALLANVITGLMITNSALLVDLHRDRTASAGAASNLARCLLSAALIAGATPLINEIGLGPFGVVVAGIWIIFLPGYLLVYYKGFKWRKAKAGSGELA